MNGAGYVMERYDGKIAFQGERFRRVHDELIGELSVLCKLPGARTVNGFLSVADFNFSSAAALKTRAKDLAERARSNGSVDWIALLDEFRQGVFLSEREGDPAVDLRNVVPAKPDDVLRFAGLRFPSKHASILFGDGGTLKSLLALLGLGQLAEAGMPVALFDWELGAEDHRERLGRLFGPTLPQVFYCRCERPLTAEVDRLARVVRDHKIRFAVFDSVAFASDGPPEAAEVAARYFRAVREIGCGSLHIAHVTKAENADQRPFGSAFWHNSARSTWYVQATEPAGDGSVSLGLLNRKANLGPISAPVSHHVRFSSERIIFDAANIADNPDLSQKLTVRFRVRNLLLSGARTLSEITEELGADPDTVRRTVQRYPKEFVRLPDNRIGLLGRN